MGSASEAAPPRGRRGITRASPLLLALLALVALLGVTWALFVPPWQSPDETWHFAYAQSLAARSKLPGTDQRLRAFSTDQSLADRAVGASLLAFYPYELRPQWSASAAHTYREMVARTPPSRSDGGGYNTEASNPPLLYLYDDIAYMVDDGGNAFSRLYSMQIWNVTLLLASVVGAWLLAGEVFGRRRLVQLVCAAVVGLVPEQTFMLTTINPDALLATSWTLATWMGARVINRRARPVDVAVLCALAAAAILTKATGYALVPAVLVAIAIGWRNRPAEQRRVGRARLAAALTALVVPVAAWLGYAHATGRALVNAISNQTTNTPHPFLVTQFLSYLWQFYLPKLGFMTTLRTSAPALAVYNIWLRQGWGTFGYVDVSMPGWAYTLLGAVTAFALVVGTILLVRISLARHRRTLELTTFFVVSLGGLLLLLHVSDYRSVIAGDGPLLQGRYLLPVLSLFGLVVALCVSRVPAPWRAPAVGAVIAGLLLVQLLALSSVAVTYYT